MTSAAYALTTARTSSPKPRASKSKGTTLPLTPQVASGPDRQAMESYASWLFYERRLLCRQLHPGYGPNAEDYVAQDKPGAKWHFPTDDTEAQAERWNPAARAAAVLDGVGVNWRHGSARAVNLVPFSDGDYSLPKNWSHPDAELLETASALIAASKQCRALVDSEEYVAGDPEMLEAIRGEADLIARLSKMPARTPAGVVTKARALQIAGAPDYPEETSKLVGSLVDDVLRVAAAITGGSDPIPALIETHRAAVAAVEAVQAEREAIEAREPWLYPIDHHVKFSDFEAANPDFRGVLDRQSEAGEAEEKALNALLHAAASHPAGFAALAQHACELTEGRDGPAIVGTLPAHRLLAAFAGLPCLQDENGEPVPATT